MIENLLAELRKQVELADNLPESTREDLLQHVEAMEASHANSAIEESEEAESVAEEPQGIDRLVSSVEELEASHPEITATVNRIATVLGNMGI
jgi:hypothetical protein